ncbi:MAG: hypothetical protein ACRCVJ_05695 [Clostridium sp.]|uniref:hypothetical protein n=1 Tax=Clostridium sp. TaxID=1506 RepID=UPI003F3179C1
MLICLAGIRIYICDKIKLDYFLAGMYPVNIITFIFISVAISVNSNNKNMSFFVNSIMVIGIIIFSIAAVLSLKNIKKQYINSNKLIILVINFVCVVSVIPALLISIIMPLVDLGIFIRHIESLGIYHRT